MSLLTRTAQIYIILLFCNLNNSFGQTIITQWNFNGPSATEVPGGGASPSPSIGNGSANLQGGTSGNFFSGIVNGGSSDPENTVPPNYAWGISSFPPQSTGSGTAGVAFFCNTSGFENIQFSYDIRASATAASRWLQYEYTLNGVDWLIFGDNGGSMTPGETWFNQINIDLSGIPGANDNPNFGIRLVSIFSPVTFNPGNPDIEYPPNSAYHRVAPDGPNLGGYSANGTWRFDMATFTGECQPLVVNITADQNPICTGESTNLTASGSGSFEWSEGSSGQSISVSPVSTEIYTVTATNNGCTGTATITVIVEDESSPVISGIPDEICNSASAIILPLIQDGVSGNWSGTGVSNNAFDPAGLSGSIELIFTPDPGQCATLTSHFITVLPPPTASASNDGPVCSQQGDVLTLSAEGGISYEWSGPGGFSSTQQNPVITDPLPSNSGTYTVTVIDSNGCSATAQTTVTVHEGFSLEGAVLENVDCANGNNGSISVSMNGTPQFFPPPTFEWEHPPGFDPFGQNWDFFGENIFEDLPPGTYGLTITDARGCFASIELVITEPTPILLDCYILNNETSPGAEDGAFGFNLDGGTPEYLIEITGPYNFTYPDQVPGNYTFSLLPPGIYEVIVTDENGCTQTCTVIISPSDCEIEVFLISATDPSCNGAEDGSIEVGVSGESGIVTFNWQGPSPIGNSSQGNNLLAGTYLVTVTDENDCVATLQIILNQPPPQQITCALISNESGSGMEDGVISVVISGGQYPGTLSLTGPSGSSLQVNGEGTYEFENLLSGTYTVVFEDANGCTTSCEIEVLLCELVISIDITEEINCAGDQTGELVLTISGQSGNFFITWSGGLPPFPLQSGLAAGLYEVTVADESGCIATAQVTLTEPDPMMLICSSQPEVNGGDGSLIFEISGGVVPYDVAYSGPQNGSLQISEPGQNTINNLPAGAYTIEVTDSNGCTTTCQVVIQAAGCDLSIQLLVINGISCAGDNNAELLVTTTNGAAPFNYNWLGPVMIDEDENNPINLPPGSYSVTVTDANDCTAIGQLTINEPLPLNLICASIQESNEGAEDGQLIVNISGGTPDYEVVYTGPSNGSVVFQTPGVFPIGGLVSGLYEIIVTDANGCSASCSVVILQGDCTISVSASFNNPRCPGQSTGEIGLSVNGANGNVTYQWNGPVDPGNVPAFTMFPQGTYIITVTDEASCSATIEIILQDPAPIILVCSVDQDASMPGANDGQATITWTNGSPTFRYDIDGPLGPSQSFTNNFNATFTQLPAGDYTVTVTDMGGCTAVCSFRIRDVACDIEVNLNIIDPINCFGFNQGRIEAVVTGALGTVTYQWLPIQPNNPIISNLAAGVYRLTVTDEQGCSATREVQLTQPPLLRTQCSSTPASGPGSSDGVITINIQGGISPYNLTWSGNSTGSQVGLGAGNFNINNLEAGQYLLVVRDANGCEASCIIFIFESPCELEISCSQLTEASGPGIMDGAANVQITGSGQPFSISWSGPSFGFLDGLDGAPVVLSNLLAGIYVIEVTDTYGCTAECSFEIEELACNLELSCTVVENPSAADNDGVARATWNFQSEISYELAGPAGFLRLGQALNLFDFSDLPSGNYQLIIIAPNGCRDTCDWVLIASECTLEIAVSTMEVSCNGKSDGSIDVIVDKQIGQVVIDWSDGNNDFSRIGLSAGIYALTVSDDAGCSATGIVEIVQPLPISFEYTVFQPTCDNPLGSLFITSASQVNLPATARLNGQAYTIISFPFQVPNLTGGVYIFELLDAELCESSFQFSIASFNRVRLLRQGDRVVNRGDNVLIEVLIDGNPIDIDQSEISFSNQLLCQDCSSSSLIATQSGQVSIRIVDINGCEDLISFNLIVKLNSSVFIPDVFTPNGDGINDIFEVFTTEGVAMIRVFRVFDRWGSIVFDAEPFTTDERRGWDGKYKNVELDPAAFVYMIEVEYEDGDFQIFSGEIILAR